ncbi:MAG: type II toxin-antitoxin system RelB/DinJ family antitoxin [Eggerthellaceae bacterium]|nr:type II toxin-antitoxin system RelB/DinJ family antitoxin [Eggerthellaceae bacterium]
MSTRKAEVKGYVLPNVKEKATKVYAHWGISLSDAINAFLIKSIDVGGFPFDMREVKPNYNKEDVLPVDALYGSSILPADMNNEEDDIYESLVD